MNCRHCREVVSKPVQEVSRGEQAAAIAHMYHCQDCHEFFGSSARPKHYITADQIVDIINAFTADEEAMAQIREAVWK